MHFFVNNAHLIWSVVFLAYLEYLHSGRWSSFRLSSMFCLVTIIIGLMLFCATFLLHVRLRGWSIMRIPLLMLIGILDFFVLINSFLALISCINRRGLREFWGEAREIDRCVQQEAFVDKVFLCPRLNSLAQARVKLSLTKMPHRCIGCINTFAAGRLFARIVDPENERVLTESKWCNAKWSLNPTEMYAFNIPCYMMLGRLDKLYFVRCELWFSPEDNGEEEKLAEVFVKTNGWF